jgi:thiamine biosynthesis lipoprotein
MTNKPEPGFLRAEERVMTEQGDGTRPSRRDVLRIVAVGGAAALAWKTGLLRGGPATVVTRSRTLMGTMVNLTVAHDDREAADAGVDATLARMAELESRLSRYQAASDVSRLNAAGSIHGASDSLLEVLELSDRISRLGEGAFDVTIQPLLDLYGQRMSTHHALPDADAIARTLELVDYRALRVEGRSVSLDKAGARITLDGVGKGYIIDQGVAELRRHGLPNVFVEAGGDLKASGEKDAGRPWRVGIRSPRRRLTVQARLEAADRAVATSGDYMQPFTPDFAQHHILDPRTGRSSPELASATVVAPDAATADALATLTMVLGSQQGRELLEGLSDCEGYFVNKNLDVVRTSGFSLA